MDDFRDDSYTRQLPRRARSYDKLIAFITPGVRFSVRRTYHYELLKSTLVRHFYHHYRAGLVMWPTISDVVFRYRLRVPRFSKETPEDLVLYAQPSHFRQGKDGLTIGEGLFSWTSYTNKNKNAHNNMSDGIMSSVPTYKTGRSGDVVETKKSARNRARVARYQT